MITDKIKLIAAEPEEGAEPSLRSLWKEAFGDGDEFLDKFFEHAYSPKHCRCIADGNKIAAVLYWFDISCGGKKWAYIYAVATAKSHRGQGLCSFLIGDTHRRLADLGYAGAVLVPGEGELFAFYEKLGYRVCANIDELSAAAANFSCALKRIDAQEYAAKRAELLPKNAALQEGANIDFLASYAELYSGEGFLLAGYARNRYFFGVEFLGDAEKIPAVLAALGCDEGSFRGIFTGADYAASKPFAMSVSFTYGATPPSYFGLAFD